MKAWMSMAAVATLVGGAGRLGTAAADTTARSVDSGRYGVEAACEPKGAFLACSVSIRDLVYDTMLVNSQKLGLTPGGALGSALSFDGNPAQGPRQNVAIHLDPAAAGQGQSLAARAQFLVEVREGAHLVQRYSFVVPVAAK